MSEPTSAVLQGCLDRLRAGDLAARDELLNAASGRLTGLTRRMLADYQRVRRWEETGDVSQNAVLRLRRALEAVTPPTVRDFYRLAAAQVRRELIDLARHYHGPRGVGANHASQPSGGVEAGDASAEPGRLAAWSEFHAQAGVLPEDEREVFDLLYYQGLSQDEAAVLLGVTVRTVKRRWQGARLALHAALGGDLPGLA